MKPKKFIIYLVLVVAANLLLVDSESTLPKEQTFSGKKPLETEQEQIILGDSDTNDLNLGQGPESEEAKENETVIVKRVIDGDTIVLEDNRIIRLIGVNTPEKHQWFYQEATNKTKELVLGKEVILEYDKGRYDKYGRTLAYVYFEDSFINYELLKQGYGRLMVISPNMKYFNEFKKAQAEARAEKQGIWKGE